MRLFRGFLQLRGADTTDFLQGLITNNIKKVTESTPFLFTAFLNSTGRILCDAFIYQEIHQSNSFIIECDPRIKDSLKSHVTKYRLDRDVDIQDKSETYMLHINSSFDNSQGIVAKDPRNELLGSRSIHFYPDAEKRTPKGELEYLIKRITLGVNEGIDDFPPLVGFPLENNLVDFNKGCYLGQELTIRTYHRGAIRKRVYPIQLHEAPNQKSSQVLLDDNFLHKIDPGTEIKGLKSQKVLGRIGSIHKNIGLAMLRFEKLTEDEPVVHLNDKTLYVEPFLETLKNKMEM